MNDNKNLSRSSQDLIKELDPMQRMYIEDFCYSLRNAFQSYCREKASKEKRAVSMVAEDALKQVGIRVKTFDFWLNHNAIINKIENPDNPDFQKISMPDFFRVVNLCALIGNSEPLEYMEKFKLLKMPDEE